MKRLSAAQGARGRIKSSPEDFIVEEISKNGTTLEAGKSFTAADLGFQDATPDSKFTVFVMQKRGWNTAQALTNIARKCRRGRKSAGFAGTKDKVSTSVQLCSMYGVTPEELSGVRIRDISINGAWRSDTEVKLGDLLGNSFRVKIDGMAAPGQIEIVDKELGGIFPNYFGQQRFGFRDNNVEIGLDIMKGAFESAASRFLTDTNNENNGDAVAARRRLASEQDHKAALGYFPQYLKYEITVLRHLAQYPTDYAGALRKLPRNILLMFVHSVDSRIFNRELDSRIESGKTTPERGDLVCLADAYGFPDIEKSQKWDGKGRFVAGNIIGYNTEPNEIEKSIMEEMGITASSFKVGGMPELNCKGDHRALFAPYLRFKFDETSSTLSFSLPSGSYATVLLDEFLKRSME